MFAKTKFYLSTGMFIFFIGIFFIQCNKEEIESPVPPFPVENIEEGTLNYTNINATVTDEQGIPLAGVTIESNGKTAITNNFGVFILNNVSVYNERVKIEARKTGYFNTFYATKLQGTNTKVKMVMAAKNNVHTITSNTANTIDANTAQVDLPANGYVDANGNAYNGTIEVAVRHFNPTEERFELLMPGGDFRGQTTDGEEKLLISYGAISVELSTPNGEELNLADGQHAEIRLQVPSELMANAPSTIPLWHFNETTLIWEEEGSATLIGNEYIGTVSHFSTWNCDDPVNPKTFVNGYVLDCNDEPMDNVAVSVGPLVVYTNEFGFYETNAAVDLSFAIFVSPEYNYGLLGNTINVAGLSEGEVLTAENIILPCPAYIEGVVQDCDGNPVAANVLASWSTGNNVIYTDDGSFNLVVGGEEVTLSAISSDLFTGETTITSVVESTVSLPNPLQVCEELEACNIATFEQNGEPYIIAGTSYVAYPSDSDYIGHPFIDLSGESVSQLVISSSTDVLVLHLPVHTIVEDSYNIEVESLNAGNASIVFYDNVLVADTLSTSFTQYIFESGQIAITNVTATEIEGTFYGNSWGLAGAGDLEAVNGYFCISNE